ncbi:MAG: hypothetical protein KZQ88_04050 [Candidatus Thiodiazotropha sp. (ex Dulcina madagascariensis)]|nr:hypothetical protein [Candidatus Thiodiazotropha sp. (ex Dulcina madagascariensis)]MCU7925269.1 hypothetical protein [Candidatus Thiodiazotropha sp. (ex Dulcina madagascariensis)]
MKLLALMLLLPSLLFAQQPPPGGNVDPQQFFEESKQKMLPMMEKSLPAMQQTKACLEKAEDQAAFEKCTEIMTAMEKEIREKMGPMPGMPEGQATSKGPKDIVFNAEVKKGMMQFLDRSIMIGSAMKKCFSESASMEQMQHCMQASKPKRNHQ